MLEIVVLDTPTLGDRSYLVHDGSTAFVVDPQRDIDRVLDAARDRGVRITDVFETHIHNDYVTGGYALAETCDARYHVNSRDPVRFLRNPISDGDVVRVSPRMAVRAVATPGHTHTHLAYVLGYEDEDVAVFTGGSLLYGSTGRPDLLGPDHADGLAHAQWASARRLAETLPGSAEVWPTHGFGSFCSATQSEATSSTLATERTVNPVFEQAEDEWVSSTLAGLDAWPAYYAHMGPANLAGPGRANLKPPAQADATQILCRIRSGEWVVDLRHRKAFLDAHVPGSLSFGLDGNMATYLGWLIPWGTPLTLLGDSPEDVATAQRELVRIGIDRPAAAATGTVGDWLGAEPARRMASATFADLGAVLRHREVVVLDVRRRLEWEESHLADAVHIPLQELTARIGELPDGELWVHCRSGYRATIAGSLLARAGRQVVVVDDEWDTAAGTGLPVIHQTDRD